MVIAVRSRIGEQCSIRSRFQSLSEFIFTATLNLDRLFMFLRCSLFQLYLSHVRYHSFMIGYDYLSQPVLISPLDRISQIIISAG